MNKEPTHRAPTLEEGAQALADAGHLLAGNEPQAADQTIPVMSAAKELLNEWDQLWPQTAGKRNGGRVTVGKDLFYRVQEALLQNVRNMFRRDMDERQIRDFSQQLAELAGEHAAMKEMRDLIGNFANHWLARYFGMKVANGELDIGAAEPAAREQTRKLDVQLHKIQDRIYRNRRGDCDADAQQSSNGTGGVLGG